MQVGSNNFISIEQMTGQYLNSKNVNVNTGNEKSNFADIFNRTLDAKATKELTFSKHAGERLADRNIQLSTEQLRRLEDGASRASAKGIKESLILMDDMAFIVNTSNNVVVTAMNQQNENEKIFTNIDGAVLA